MKALNFAGHVLGIEAASRLRERQVTQTIRSRVSRIVVAIKEGRIKPNDLVQVMLDNKFVGYARLLAMDEVTRFQLGIEDVRRGGFGDDYREFAHAFERAGYRFPPYKQYRFYRLRFM